MKNFFIVGAQRSSTTWLCKMLQQHPQIDMAQPIRPEPKYFLTDDFVNNISIYQSKYFRNINHNVLACGEKSTTYIESEVAAQRIATMFPNSSIIMLLRNPIKRALSNYNFSVKNGLEHRTLIDALLNKVPPRSVDIKISTDPFNYLGRGLYQNHIEMYQKYFPKESLLILNNETITQNISCLANTYEFLGADKNFLPNDFNRADNSSSDSEEVSAEVINYLQQYYSKTFDFLSENFGIFFEKDFI